MKISIKYGIHEYHLENVAMESAPDIEIYLNGMFIRSFTNLCSAIGHCLEQINFDTDLQYVTRNRQ